MCKIKSLTKDDKIFLIILICYMLFSYFFSKYSLLWLLYEFVIGTGAYYLISKSPLSDKFSTLTKNIIGVCLIILLIAPPLFIFENNSWIYRTTESVEQNN